MAILDLDESEIVEKTIIYIDYSMGNYLNYDKEYSFQASLLHLQKKKGNFGYLKFPRINFSARAWYTWCVKDITEIHYLNVKPTL